LDPVEFYISTLLKQAVRFSRNPISAARTMATAGYYSNPTIHGNRVVFCCEGDLWLVDNLDCGAPHCPRRLTTGGDHSTPFFSPDGEWLAFSSTSSETGMQEVFVMPSQGARPTRLTSLGVGLRIVGWVDGAVLFASEHATPPPHGQGLFSVAFSGKRWDANAPGPVPLNLGPADCLLLEPAAVVGGGRRRLLGRHTEDPSVLEWKRYQGGKTGQLWLETGAGSGCFTELRLPITSGAAAALNVGSPVWCAGRIYFVADPEGCGEIFSVLPPPPSAEATALTAGTTAAVERMECTDLQQHTRFGSDQVWSSTRPFYPRFLSCADAMSGGGKLVFQRGGDVLTLDLSAALPAPAVVPMLWTSTQPALEPCFVEAAASLGAAPAHSCAALSPAGEFVTLQVRGRLWELPLWEGPAVERVPPPPSASLLAPQESGSPNAPAMAPLACPTYLGGGGMVAARSTGLGSDWELVLFAPHLDSAPRTIRLRGHALGKPLSIVACPLRGARRSGGRKLAVTNHRGELLLVECESLFAEDDEEGTVSKGTLSAVDRRRAGGGGGGADARTKKGKKAMRERKRLGEERKKRLAERRKRRAARSRARRLCVDSDPWTVIRLAVGRTDEGLSSPAFSEDGEWLAFVQPLSTSSTLIRLCELGTGVLRNVTDGSFVDSSPTFDERGRFLFFVSARQLLCADSRASVELPWGEVGFSYGEKIFAVSLTRSVGSPLRCPPIAPGVPDEDVDSSDDGTDSDDGDGGGEDSDWSSGESVSGSDGEGSDSADADEAEEGWIKPATPVRIEFDGLQHRITELPVPTGTYSGLRALRAKTRGGPPEYPGHRTATSISDLIYTRREAPQRSTSGGIVDDDNDSSDDEDLLGRGDATLCKFSFGGGVPRERQLVDYGVCDWTLSLDRTAVALVCKDAEDGDEDYCIRVLRAGEKPAAQGGDGGDEDGDDGDGSWSETGPASGLIDLSRIRCRVDPREEWAQMFECAAREVGEAFHDHSMRGWAALQPQPYSPGLPRAARWAAAVPLYRALLPRIASRNEWTDLVAELQAELQSSHCYSWGENDDGGLFRGLDDGEMGFLGVTTVWEPGVQGGHEANRPAGLLVTELVLGDCWNPQRGGALAGALGNVKAGDVIVSVDSVEPSRAFGLGELLANRAGTEVFVAVWQPPEKKQSTKKQIDQGDEGEQDETKERNSDTNSELQLLPRWSSRSELLPSGEGEDTPSPDEEAREWAQKCAEQELCNTDPRVRRTNAPKAPKVHPGRRVVLRATASTWGVERAARYRDWVSKNRSIVHEQSSGKVGYVLPRQLRQAQCIC